MIPFDKFEEGYFKAPDFAFNSNLPLSALSRLLLCYFCRMARGKNGWSFPSKKTICKQTGIKAENTVDKAIKSLITLGLVRKVPNRKGKSNQYCLTEPVIKAVNKNKKSKDKEQYITPSNIEHEDTQILSTKEYIKKENINKEGNDSISENDLKHIVDEHMKTLTPEKRQLLESRAIHQREFGCPPPDRKRIEWYRLLFECIAKDQGDLL